MSVRPATSADHDVVPAAWRSGPPLDGVHVLVEEHEGRVVVAGRRRSSPLHTVHESLELVVPHQGCGAALLGALAAISLRPMLLRGVPGTIEHALALEAGARVVQRVPAGRVPSGPAARAWSRTHAGPTRRGDELSLEELVHAWVTAYEHGHDEWSPVAERDVLIARSTPFVAERVDRPGSRVAVDVHGAPVALSMVAGEVADSVVLATVQEVRPDHPQLLAAVGAVMAAVLDGVAPAAMEFDGHESDASYARLLQTVPGRTSSELTPMELLQVPPQPGPDDVKGGPGWLMAGTTLRPVITDVPSFRAGVANDPLGRAVELLWTDRPASAERWLQSQESTVRVRALRADCRRDLGDHDGALAAYRQLVAECAGGPREAVMRQHHGKALMAGGEYGPAAQEFEIALRLRLEAGADATLLASSRQARDRARTLAAG